MGRHQKVADLAARHFAQVKATGSPVVAADLGAGPGRVVRELLLRGADLVHALDHHSGLDDDVLTDHRVRSRITDLDQSTIPLSPGSVHSVVSLNVAEHLRDPVAHVVSAVDLLAPGGIAVLAHSDWDTCLFTSTDDDLTRALVDRFVAVVPTWADRADGFMGRKLLALVEAAIDRGCPVDIVGIDAWADVHRRFDEGSVAWKVAMGMAAAAKDDDRLAAAAARWLEGLRSLADAGQFLFTVTDVAVVLQRHQD